MDLSRPRCSPWMGLVLVASLLACGVCQASGQIFIPQYLGIKGYRGVMALENAPENVQEYSWYRGAHDNVGNMIISYKPPNLQETGPMYTGREKVNSRGDLLIKECQLNDTGNYTIRVDTGNEIQRATGWLEIVELGSNPGISVNATSVVENWDSVVAECHTNVANITWYVNDVPISSSNRRTISPDGKTLVIHRVSRYDRALQCVVEKFSEIFQRSERIPLTVAFGPDYVVLWGEPDSFNGILTAKLGSRVEMKCDAYSSPSPTYRWIHNGSLLDSSDDNITLSNLTWEQTGSYRCVVENPVAQLTLYTTVSIQMPRDYPLLPGLLPPAVPRGFYITEPLVIFLIVVAVLGGVYLSGVLIHALISHYSTRTNRAI
ncbi:carcinoembryonic antigen-related cell adhesion molecule 18 [Carlito syrichta]|uniref:Carcinoembryonic antigen-related cell adhesion molecule 18 n=1 Tax=Carlito syrichta TaxID=1868482 RepID=A0A1U7SI78_CARSF|nr:carcinoembryonic antigen-related cell adhesion molecule 18 [Carlito syrichta]